MHLQIGIQRALDNEKRDKKFTKKLSTEILYFLSPHHSIQESLKDFGIAGATDAVFLLFLDMHPKEKTAVQELLNECCTEEELEKHAQYF